MRWRAQLQVNFAGKGPFGEGSGPVFGIKAAFFDLREDKDWLKGKKIREGRSGGVTVKGRREVPPTVNQRQRKEGKGKGQLNGDLPVQWNHSRALALVYRK